MQDGQKSSLTDFPMEILMHILGFLPPKWIVVMRKCCNKTLAAATHERTVWMAALRQVCADHHVFGCTFTITEMTTLDLERAATSHHRFSSRLRHEFGEEPLIPMLLRVIPARNDTYLQDPKLVPGGRFMLTCVGQDQSILQLWDLGFASNDLSCSLPIATTEIFGIRSTSEILVQPTSDGLGVRVLMPSSPSENRVQFSIYEVFPLSASPTFHLVSTLLCTGELRGCAICFLSDRLAFTDGENILVWNYAMNTYAIWPNGGGACAVIVITETDLLLMESGVFWIDQIPDLQPYAPGTNAIIGPRMPSLRLACPLKCEHICSTDTYDLPSASVPRCIDVVGETEVGTSVISRFEIPTDYFAVESTNQATDDGQRRLLPTSTYFFHNVGEPCPQWSQRRGLPWFSSLCDDSRLVHCVVYDRMHYDPSTYTGEVKAHLTVMVNGSASGMDWTCRWGTLWEYPFDIEIAGCYSLCSMSGRMCASTDVGLYIVDYLIPPT